MTVTLIAILVVVYLLSIHHGGLPPFLLDLLILGLLGPSLEGALGRIGFCALAVAGSLLALTTRALAGAGSPSPVVFSTSGATVAVLGGYILFFPRARVLTLVAVPFFTTIVEIPAVLLIGLWFFLQVYFGLAGLG